MVLSPEVQGPSLCAQDGTLRKAPFQPRPPSPSHRIKAEAEAVLRERKRKESLSPPHDSQQHDSFRSLRLEAAEELHIVNGPSLPDSTAPSRGTRLQLPCAEHGAGKLQNATETRFGRNPAPTAEQSENAQAKVVGKRGQPQRLHRGREQALCEEMLRVLTASLSLCRGAAALVHEAQVGGPEHAGQNGAGIAAQAAGSRQPHISLPDARQFRRFRHMDGLSAVLCQRLQQTQKSTVRSLNGAWQEGGVPDDLSRKLDSAFASQRRLVQVSGKSICMPRPALT